VSNRTVSDIGEHALIARITARLAKPSWVLVGPGDDAAVVQPERGALDVLTTDAQVEGIHFDRRFVPPDAIGHRALAVSISDLAAMGAAPRAVLLSLVLPDQLEVAVVDGIMDGFIALAERHRIAVIGGNITRSPGPLMIDVTAIGSAKPRRILTRAGARPGDEVFVTGAIGGAAVGLHSLRARADGPEARTGGPEGPLLPANVEANLQVRPSGNDVETDLQVRLDKNEQRFLRPEPRMRAGLLLGRNRAASACIDLSDGLADGLRQIAAASGVGITLDEAAIPLDRGVAEFHRSRGSDPLCAALAGGEDYELLFTVRPAWRGRLRAVRSQAGDLPITRIGVVTRDTRLMVRTAADDRDVPAGFEHFR
jgi:thiamine-monophosphate kinase